jgi:glycerol-3-phosphate dehydrogenase
VVAESQTNDSRLVLATVTAAARAGADVANYVRVLSFEQARGRLTGAMLEGAPGEGLLTLRCRAIVNCTGPWVDHVRRLEDPAASPAVRLSKGVNIVLPLHAPWRAGLALFDSGHSLLAAPWHGLLLLGATDSPYDDAPDAALVAAEDVDQLLDAFRDLLPDHVLRRDRVLSACVGLRVLERGGRPTTHAARDEVLRVGPRGMVSVAGGKLTTHRLIAAAALRALPADLRTRRLRCDERPLTHVPERATVTCLRDVVGADVTRYLVAQYGGAVDALVSSNGDSGLAPIAADGPDVWAQAFVARDAEWALCIDDVVARRTTLELRGLARADLRSDLAAALGLPQSVAGSDSVVAVKRADVSAT